MRHIGNAAFVLLVLALFLTADGFTAAGYALLGISESDALWLTPLTLVLLIVAFCLAIAVVGRAEDRAIRRQPPR
jgi:hypothetical protein